MTSKNVVLVHGGFVDGSGWEAVYRSLRKDGHTVTVVQNPTISLSDDVRVTKRAIRSTRRPRAAGRAFIWRGRDYGSWKRSQSCRTDLHRCLCSGQRGIGVQPNQGSAGGRAGASDSAATGGLLISRQGEVSRFVCGRCGRRKSRVHGRLPSAVGRRSARWQDQPTSLEDQAKLVLGRHRRPDDSTARAAFHVEACRSDGRGGPRQSRSICLPAWCGRRSDCKSCRCHEMRRRDLANCTLQAT